MDPYLELVAEAGGGYFTREQALSIGHHDRSIREALHTHEWERVRVGAYAPGEAFRALAPQEQHLVAARACTHKLGNRVALSHTTAVLAHGIATVDVDLRTVHALRLDGGSSRRESGVCHHEAKSPLLPHVARDAHGQLVVAPAAALRQAATLVDQKRAAVMVDSALHLGLVTVDELTAIERIFERWPQAARFRLVLAFADARAESPGETLVRWICKVFGLPRPELQRVVRDALGVAGRTDFSWLDGRHLGEFDGKVKYLRLVREGETASDAVVREKAREDRLRATRAGMSRFVWSDVLDRNEGRTAERLRREIEQSRQLFVPARASLV
ncbi:MAG: type IV toxin-antitoxin system AbiEi family antitoxin domain-containing protein [Nocardioidaceae bacterium]|nr:type IV toxin-antitoxin system AbiEi family antitoxin domain-containing protein [Nocardioidaceae bacterium]